MFDKFYVKATKDSPEVLKEKGTPVECCVKSIKDKKRYYVVEASPTSGVYVDRVFTGKSETLASGTRIGGFVTCYVDEVDADGEYFLDV